MSIRLNEDKEIVKTIKEGLKKTGGYCPCRFEKNEDNKCMCKEFKEQIIKRVEELTKILNEANYNYYVLNESKITDQEFDKYLRELEVLEEKYLKKVKVQFV